MRAGGRIRISTGFVATVVAFFVASGISGYLARSFVSEVSPRRVEEFCAELRVDAAELKRKYLKDLGRHVRRYLRAQKIPFVAVRVNPGAVGIKFPTTFGRSEALELAPALNFSLLVGDTPGLTYKFEKKLLLLIPTPAAINERLLASANGNIDYLSFQFTSLGVGRFRVERLSQSALIVRLPIEDGRQAFAKTIGVHPIETTIRLLQSIETAKFQSQEHAKFRDTIEPGWFNPDRTYHLSRYSILHEGQLAGVEQVVSRSGEKLLRLHLQSDAAHRLWGAVKRNPDGKLSLSVHNRVVSDIRARDIDAYGVIDFPVPADGIRLQEILRDIKLSLAQTALKVVKLGTCS